MKNIIKTIYRLAIITAVVYLGFAQRGIKANIDENYVTKAATDTMYIQPMVNRLNLHQTNFNLLGKVLNTQMELDSKICAKLKIENPFSKAAQEAAEKKAAAEKAASEGAAAAAALNQK